MNIRSELIHLNLNNRLYQINVPIIGLTGGIATGKSTVSKYLKDKYKLEIIDADLIIKTIYQREDTLNLIRLIASDCINDNQINFPKLREIFFKNNDLKQKIEKHLFSKFEEVFKIFYYKQKTKNFIIYDVPLLFEKDLDKLIDINILVYASRETQIKRIQKRDQTDLSTINKILDAQIDIEEKKSKAQFVIDNSKNKKAIENQWPEVDVIIQSIFN